jgi:hypothetical protein
MCVCVGNKERTNREPANNQASAQYYTMSEVGIPMFRLQMIEIINVSHGHQLYTVDPCHQDST